MDWHILTMLPLLGLTNSWRGVRIGGKVIGGVGGLGASNNPAVQAFDKAKAAGDREGMERAARQLNEQRMERNRAKSSGGASGSKSQPIQMASLKGTEKQVKWAEDIRSQHIASLDKQISDAKQKVSKLNGEGSLTDRQKSRLERARQRIKDAEIIKETISRSNDSVDFIDSRNISFSPATVSEYAGYLRTWQGIKNSDSDRWARVWNEQIDKGKLAKTSKDQFFVMVREGIDAQ